MARVVKTKRCFLFFQNASRHNDTLEHYGAGLLMLKNGCFVCSKAKLETPDQYNVTLEEELSFLGMCNEPPTY
jgi:hypothetical protein